MSASRPQPERFRSARFLGIFGSALSGDVAGAIAAVAIPLLVVGPLHASDGLVGVAVAADDVGWLLAGPIAGVLIDRYGFKRLLLGSETVRFVAFAVISVLAIMGYLHPGVFIALVALKSVASVFFLIGAPSLIARSIVDEDLVRANSALSLSQSLSLIFGPPLAGAIAALSSVTLAFAVTSVGYLISVLLLTQVLRGPQWEAQRSPDPTSSLRSELVAGWSYLRRRGDVVRLVLAGAQFNFALSMQQAALVVYLLTLPGFSVSLVGIALGAAGLAGVFAAMLADQVSKRFGDARAVFWIVLLGTILGLLLPLTRSIATTGFLAAGYFGLTVATVVFSAITGAYRQRTIPAELLGRTTASSRLISWGIAPFGALLGGLLIQIWSPWSALMVSAVLFVGTAFWMVGMKWTTAATPDAVTEEQAA